MLRTFATAALLVLSIGAAKADPPPAITIPIGDLNLANPGDARILAGRAQAAAQTACADWKPDRWQSSSYHVNLFYKSIYDSCVGTTRHRVISRAMDKAADRAARLAAN